MLLIHFFHFLLLTPKQVRKNEQMRSPRSNRANQSNGGGSGANGLLGLPGGAFDGAFKAADPFFGGAAFDAQKLLDSKNLPLSALLMGAAADARNIDPAAYFHANGGVPPNLMSFNSLLSMAASTVPNYLANPELLSLFMRQFEPKAFKELPEQVFNNGLVNGDEMLKNKVLFDNHQEQTLRKLFQQLVAGSPPAPATAAGSKNGQPNEQLNSSNLQNDQNLSNNNISDSGNNNNNINANNLSNSFLNLSKMSDSDSSSTSGKKEHPTGEVLVNGKDAKGQLSGSKKSTPESSTASKKEEEAAASEAKATAAANEMNGKQNTGSNNHHHNHMKMDSEDEESQRDSSSLDDEMLMSDGKKVRVRSVLSEETLRVLRAQYAVNPRPKKQEIQRLSEQVNYSTRVVQVWFQNMRFVNDLLLLSYVVFCIALLSFALTFC